MSSGRGDWFQKVRARPEADAEGWVRCSGLYKWEAEELLDWLEVNGYAQREVSFAAPAQPQASAPGGFTVRWRP